MSQWVVDYVIMIIVGVLGMIILTTYMVLLIGLFTPAVDNKDIFAVITPTLNSTVGGFIGILSAMKMLNAVQGAPPKIGPSETVSRTSPLPPATPMGAPEGSDIAPTKS